jgi:hypothetical protein
VIDAGASFTLWIRYSISTARRDASAVNRFSMRTPSSEQTGPIITMVAPSRRTW